MQSAADPQYQDPREPMDSDDEERRQEARRALEALTPRERQLLLLRHEGYSYRELSVALRIVETSIGTLLARAKVSFRAALEGVGHAPT